MSTPKNSQTVNISFGNVIGQIHTGSGDINVTNFMAGTKISTKEEFLAALQALKSELISEKLILSEPVVNKTVNEIDLIDEEAKKQAPKSNKIIQRLKKMKEILTTGTEVITATSAVATATGKFIPFIEKAIEIGKKIF